ncbi:MAG: magnesium transporter [Candidatus Omnitrophota bacterium]
MKHLTDAEKWKLLAGYDANQAASDLGEKAPEQAAEITEELGVSYMVEVVSRLDSAAAAGMLRSLPGDFREKILAGLSPERVGDIREVLSYPEGTAGALMAKECLAVSDKGTIGEATAYLQLLPRERKGKVSYIYVVDDNRRLVGVIQVRDLIFHPPETPVTQVFASPVVQVETGMSQRDVAKLLQRHRYLGLPVVDSRQKLVGVISADSVLEAAEEAAADDIAKIVGTSAEEIKTRSVIKILRARLPWLLVNIASGLLCAVISGVFQNNLATIAVLFLFVPVVLGLSESTGVQGATIVVRNLALGHVSFGDLGSLFIREVVVGVVIGLACGTIVGSAAYFWKGDSLLGVALASSMTLAIFISGLIGLVLPILFRRMKFDPAIASGPLVLAICDLQTLFVYFGLSGRILAA